MTPTALIFANGAANDGSFVQQALKDCPNPTVIAADGGAHMAHDRFGLRPHIVIGDMDSASAELLAQLEAAGTEIVRYPAEKNETDLELALLWAAEHGATTIRVIGALGRRIDQTFANVYLLAHPRLATCDVRFVAGEQQIWLARPGTHQISGKAGDTLSLIPMSAAVNDIETENLYYPLRNETLHVGPARGISNVLTQDNATVSFGSGILLFTHFAGRAE